MRLLIAILKYATFSANLKMKTNVIVPLFTFILRVFGKTFFHCQINFVIFPIFLPAFFENQNRELFKIIPCKFNIFPSHFTAFKLIQF